MRNRSIDLKVGIIISFAVGSEQARICSCDFIGTWTTHHIAQDVDLRNRIIMMNTVKQYPFFRYKTLVCSLVTQLSTLSCLKSAVCNVCATESIFLVRRTIINGGGRLHLLKNLVLIVSVSAGFPLTSGSTLQCF